MGIWRFGIKNKFNFAVDSICTRLRYMVAKMDYAVAAAKNHVSDESLGFGDLVSKINYLITKRISVLDKIGDGVKDKEYGDTYSRLVQLAFRFLSDKATPALADASIVIDSSGKDRGHLYMQRTTWAHALRSYDEYYGNGRRSEGNCSNVSSYLKQIVEAYNKHFEKTMPQAYGFVPNHVSKSIPRYNGELYHLVRYSIPGKSDDNLIALQRLARMDVDIEDLLVYKPSKTGEGVVEMHGKMNGETYPFEARRMDTSIFVPESALEVAFPVVACIREMFVISKKTWFGNGEAPLAFNAYGVRIGAAYVDRLDQFPVRFTKFEQLDAKDQKHMRDGFNPKAIRSGNVGSICSELLDRKYSVNWAYVGFESGVLLIDAKSKSPMPRPRTINNAHSTSVRQPVPSFNRFAALNTRDRANSETASEVSWAEEMEPEYVDDGEPEFLGVKPKSKRNKASGTSKNADSAPRSTSDPTPSELVEMDKSNKATSNKKKERTQKGKAAQYIRSYA